MRSEPARNGRRYIEFLPQQRGVPAANGASGKMRRSLLGRHFPQHNTRIPQRWPRKLSPENAMVL